MVLLSLGVINVTWSTKKTFAALRMVEMISLSTEFGTNCSKGIGMST